MRRLLFPLFLAAHAVLAADAPMPAANTAPSKYYQVETIETPPGLSPEVGGMAFMPDGKLVACFHRGEVYTYNPETKEWKLFALGLQDPLGLIAPKNDEVIVMQRPELTRLRDTDGDGVADKYETICDSFGMTGNYHEFAFGPLAVPDGGWFVALNTASDGSGVRQEVRGEYREQGRDGRMFSVVSWRGWVAKITPDGKLTPWASGFRSPNGLGYDAAGRLFVPDNQGDWIGTDSLYHVEKGKFYGHPASLAWKPKETRAPLTIPVDELDQTRMRASVLFPQDRMANSPTQPLTDATDGKFGPFAGQMLIGEMNFARIMRVATEEVDGQLQGMAVPLIDGHGMRKGNNRLAFAPDGSLWVGQTDHGWPGDRGIQRIRWTGVAPLDVKEMRLTKTGFDLLLTRPVDAASANLPETYKAKRYYYEYHVAYGSKQLDMEEIVPAAVAVSEDRTKVTLEFAPLTAWRLYEFDLKDLKAEDGEPIANPLVVYTLNHLLEGTPPPPLPGGSAKSGAEGEVKAPEKKPNGKEKPAPATPAGAKPEATPPPEKKPNANPPVEKKPTVTPKPQDTKPAEAKPAEKKPAEKPAAGKKPATPVPKATPPPTPRPAAAKPTARPGVKP